MTYVLIERTRQTMQTARSLSYAKTLAPQMLHRCGTQVSLHGGVIDILTATGRPVATYSVGEGWLSVGERAAFAQFEEDHLGVTRDDD